MVNDACIACYGAGEVVTQGSYADFEQPTKKCFDCDGSVSEDIRQWRMDAWRDAVARLAR